MPFQEPELVLVDGIPVWCTDVPGPCMGGLIFRTGRIDETLVNGGINHIVEHLALYPFEPRRYDLNGTVTELTTSFYASGTRDDVEAVLSGVCAHLEALPMDRLDAERRVLETEARRGGGSFAGTASARFGARGAGVIDWPELGIRGLTGEAVEAWARERFTAGQAVGWMTRPPSDGLRLPLSAGARLPIPAAEPLTSLRTPSHITSDERFIGCSMLAPRSMPLYIAIQLFLSRGFSRLRTDLGLAYTVSQSSDRISGTDSLFLLFSDAAEGEGPRVLGTFCDVLEDLSAGALTAEDVSTTHERAMPWNATDQTRPQREATRKATASLLGHAPTTWAQLAEQGAALTPDAVQEAMRGALDTAILVIPEGVRVPERFASRPYQPAHRPRFGTLYVRWDANPHDQISLNDRGVTRQVGRSIWSADFADVEALLLGPDGSVWLVRRDGVGLLIEPNQLMRGRELASTLQDRLLDRVVDLRGDVVAWFEMQNLLESHDPSVIQSVWQEIEILAQQRRPHERVLAIAVADLDGHRGVFAVTDQRFIHVAANRPEPSVWAHRGDIATVETSTGIRGGRLQIHVRERGTTSVDRIRPRGHAAELAALPHANHRPLPVTPGHVVIGGPINRSASILGLWR